MRSSDLRNLTLAELSRALASRALSPVEVTEGYLERIHELDGSLHSFITVLPEKARAEARRAEGEIRQGQYRGPLHGVPLAI
ncbi:MAG TPA: amidase family protein, partial [bacterium]|nr:amidase family protein [bacterium]